MSVSERQRRQWRERKRDQRTREALGLERVWTDLSVEEIGWFIQTGRVSETAALSGRQLAAALRQLVREQMSPRDTNQDRDAVDSA